MIASQKAFNHVCPAAAALLLYLVVVFNVDFFDLRATTDPVDAWQRNAQRM